MYLTLLNTVLIFLILFKTKLIKVTVHRYKTFWNKTLLGYNIRVQNVTFRIPIRNKEKTELREEVERMIAEYDYQSKLQALSAKFSWLKTYDEVKKFERDYTVVDEKIVRNLVRNFISQTQ